MRHITQKQNREEMKTYDFDTIIPRDGSGDLKHEALQPRWGRKDLLPLWVADMDFATPDFIIDAMKKRLEHPILGYTVEPEGYWATVAEWIKARHGWNVKEEWMQFVPGIVKGIGLVINVFTNPGDKVIIQPPVYHPFRLTPKGNGREVVFNPLKETAHADGEHYYEMDFDDLERKADGCKVLILCNPHNPAGICWDRETLTRLADFCHERNIIVISDEIHCDMALFGHKHIPFASVSEKAAQCSITFMAPTKTFNMAALISSFTIIPNPTIRRRFFHWMDVNELSEATLMAPIATVAAFKHGEEWRKQMLAYVEGNVKYVEDFCRKEIPQIRVVRPEASFLVWLDCRNLGLDHDALLDLFIDKAHLALNDGEMFGTEGKGYMRLNVGTPREILRQAMEQQKNAVNSL